MAKKKLVPIKKLVAKLDDVFQMVIRYRDNFTCITCGKKFPKGERQQCHAGHYVSRGVYATRWDEENVNCQCAGCNLKQSLADVEVIHRYEVALEQKYGRGTVNRILEKKHQVFKLNRAWLEDNIKLYQEALDEYQNRS